MVGDLSYAWAKKALRWGARLEAVVSGNRQLSAHLKLLTDAPVISSWHVRQTLPPSSYPGLVLGTMSSAGMGVAINSLLQAWSPMDILLALPGHWSQNEVLNRLPVLSPAYHKCISRPQHADLGGVSQTVSHIIHLAKHAEPIRLWDVMTVGHYRQQLQASLEDTVPGRPGLRYTLEESRRSNYAGQVRIHKTGEMWPLLDGEELAPDLCGISSLQDLTFFV